MTGQTVVLSTTSRSMRVTHQVQDLTWRKVAPGGYASASITLERPLNVTPEEIGYFGKLYVYDGRNGATVWEGRVENLGRSADSNGQIWQVDAVGPSAHASDLTKPLLYQVTDLGGWQENHDGPAWMDRNSINTTAFGSGLQMFVPRDTVVATSTYQGWINNVYGSNSVGLAQITFHAGEDITDANWQWLSLPASASHAFVAGSSNFFTYTTGTHFTGGLGVIPEFRLTRSGTSITVASDVTAASFTNIMMRGTLFDVGGTERLDAAYYAGALTTTDVVADLLGRMLPLYDGNNAALDHSLQYTFNGGDQFAYPDGATAAQVLADLMTLCPGMYWTAGATNPVTGLWSFQWRKWPTGVRYDVSAVDGFSQPGTASGVYDSVNVRWVDSKGNAQTTVRTLANATLTAAGLHRSTIIDVGSTISGGLAAAQVGDQFLAQNAVPPAAGTLTVSRPVFDRLLGHMVQPWEMEPGFLVRVKNVAPIAITTDSDRDGTTTFRIVAVNYSQSSASVTLELDVPALTFTNAISALSAQTALHHR